MGVPLPNIPTPGLPYVPPCGASRALGFEAAQLLRSPVWRGAGVAPGEGRPVLLIPGFMAGDGTLATMTKWLRANGYWTRRAGIRANVGCSQDACERIEERLEALAARTGGKVAIVGQSRGGVLARVVAARRPDLVSGVVTLGAPTVGMLRVHPLVLLQVGVVGALGTGRVPGLFRMSCLRGAVLRAVPRRPRSGRSRPTSATSRVYSRTDGIVDWRACLDGAADELVEIHASHCGMAVSVERLRAGRPRAGGIRLRRAGAARRAQAWLGALEQRDALDVRRLREHVHGADAHEPVAGLDHLRRVRRQRGRVAGDVDDPRGRASTIRRTTFCDSPARGGSTTATSGRPACSTSSRIASRMSPA